MQAPDGGLGHQQACRELVGENLLWILPRGGQATAKVYSRILFGFLGAPNPMAQLVGAT